MKRPLRRLATVLLLALLAVALKPAQAPIAAPLQLTAQPVQLSEEDSDATAVGALRWRGGLALNAGSPAFGGLSDLVLSADGTEATLVGDKGNWATLRLSYAAGGRLADAAGIRLDAYRDRDGRAVVLPGQKDGESLTRRDGTLLVGFEQRHRIWAYPDGLDGPARAFPTPAGLQDASSNRGAEALQQLADGRLLLVAEDRPEDAESYPAWIYDGTAWEALSIAGGVDYRPTGLTQLPGGDLLLLTRKFTVLGGFQTRLARIPLADVTPGATLAGEELAHFRKPYVTDNFEGVAARRAANGETHVYLLSDDNFNALQRSLLLMFALPAE